MSRDGVPGLLEALDLAALGSVEAFRYEKGLILFSGGVDSSILATLISRVAARKEDWRLYTLGLEGSPDVSTSNDAPLLGSSHFGRTVKKVDSAGVLRAARGVADLVRCSSLAQFEDCTAFYLICEETGKSEAARSDILVTANGPDELFCGYDRFRRIVDLAGYAAARAETIRSLGAAHDLQERVKKIAAHFGRSVSEPFLSLGFVNFCLEMIPIESKIRVGNDALRKRIWREYGRFIGLPEQVALRPKRAMQYSMGIHKAVLPAIKRGELVFEKSPDSPRDGGGSPPNND